MKSEKNDHINNQETTMAHYKKPNLKMKEQYLWIYEKAKESKDIKACYLGVNKQFRIISRDSYISTVTDPEVMLELYQAFSFLSAEMMMCKFFGEIPFVIFDKKLAKMMKKKALEMKNSLISFKDSDFGKYKASMYDVICVIMKSSNLFY